MDSSTPSAPKTSPTIWTGRILSLLIAAFIIFSGVMKLQPMSPEMEEGLSHLGIPHSMLVPLAAIEIVIAILIVVPQTAVIGAILLTGYMGGAMCTHWRVGDPFIFQAVLPILGWLAVSLREPRLWGLIPWRR